MSCAPPKEVGTVLSIQRDAFEAMTGNLERHAEGRPAHHVLLVRSSSDDHTSPKTCGLMASLLASGC